MLVGMVALGLSIVNAVALGNESDARETERIESDLAGCERGNQLRRQLAAFAEANLQLIDGILDTALADRPDRRAQLESELAPVMAHYGAVTAAIELVECGEQVPGATTTTVPQENP